LAGRLRDKKYVTVTVDCFLYAALYVGYNGIRTTLGTGKLTMDTAANWSLRENAYTPLRFIIWLRGWKLPTMLIFIFQTLEILHFLRFLAYGYKSRITDQSHCHFRNNLQFSSVGICLADKDTIMIYLLLNY
jgi:hypothetical protein